MSQTGGNTSIERYIYAGQYLKGHPKITEFNKLQKFIKYQNGELMIIETSVILTEDFVNSYTENNKIKDLNLKVLATIDINNIVSVKIENKTPSNNWITFYNLFMFGILAVFAKNKENYNRYYVSIIIDDGQNKHDVIFKFEGKESLHEANRFKTKIDEYANSH